MSEQEKRGPNPNQNEGTRVARPQSSTSNSGVSSSSQKSLPTKSPSQSVKIPPPKPAETSQRSKNIPKTIDENAAPPINNAQRTIDENSFVAPQDLPLPQPKVMAPKDPAEQSQSKKPAAKTTQEPSPDATAIATASKKLPPPGPPKPSSSQVIKPADKVVPPVMESANQTKAAIKPQQVLSDSREVSYRSVPMPDDEDSGKHTAISQSQRSHSGLSQQKKLPTNEQSSMERPTPALPNERATPMQAFRKYAPPIRQQDQTPAPDSDLSRDIRPANTEDSSLLTMTPIYTETELPDADLSLSAPEDRYVEAEEFARGGLGRISRTYDKRLGRYIALKEILLDADSTEVEARFLQEAQITARLEHPSIVPVYDLGRWRGGGVYYAMKLVNGRSLDKVVYQKRTLQDRLSLLPHAIDACEAMAYAHQQRIIHRDLKPQNILVGAFGETVVIDWGIAKEVGAKDEPFEGGRSSGGQGNEMTEAGAILGTPAYMAPEQARGDVVDERTDVYALGAIIYYILCGKSPYSGERRKNSAAVLEALLDGPPVPLESREPNAPKELSAIIQKAMARDPNDRYPTAKELAADIKKFQTGQIVGAYQYTAAEIVKRFIKKNRVAVTITAVLLSVLFIGGIFSYINISRSNAREREARVLAQAETQEKIKKSYDLLLGLLRQSVEKDPTTAISYAKELLASPTFTSWRRVRTLAGDAISRGIPVALGAPWSNTGEGHSLGILALDVSSAGGLLATASDDRSVKLWDLSANQLQATLQGHADEVTEVKFSPDGKLVASSGGNADQTVRLWSTAGKELNALVHKGAVSDISFSPDGTLASGSSDGIVHIWDTTNGQEKPLTQDHEAAVLAVRFSPNGELLASYGEDEDYAVRLWHPKASPKAIRLEGHTDLLYAMAFSPDSKWLATGGEDFDVRLWDVSQSQPTSAVLSGHLWKIRALIFSPDSKTLISAGEDKAIRIWKVDSCKKGSCAAQMVLDKHQGSVVALALSPDGKILASAAQDQTVRLWELETGREISALRAHTGAIRDIAFTPDGKKLISAGDDAIPRVWDLESIERATLKGHTGFVYASAFSPDGTKIASGGDDATARIWDAKTGAVLFTLQHDTPVWEVKFSPDGRLLATACDDGLMFLWEVSTGRKLVTLRKHEAAAYGLAFSRDGKILASASVDQTVKLWDVSTGTLIRSMTGHTDEVLDLDISSDNKRFVSASLDGTLRFWNVETGAEELAFNAQGKRRKKYSSIAYSPDMKFLAAGNYSSEVEIWRLDANGLPTGESKILRGHQGEVEAVTFTPDGLSLASASWDGTVRIWELETDRWDDLWESRVLRSYGKDVDAVAVAPDGKRIVFASEDELLHLFSNDLPQDREALQTYLNQIATPELK